MREFTFISVLALAACSEAAPEKKAVEQAAVALQAGQWEVTSELANIKSQDGGTPALKDGKTITSHCVAPDEVKKPRAELFAGLNKGSCNYDNFYMSRGRLSASMSCEVPGLKGKVMFGPNGSFTATSFEAQSGVQTYLSSDGDVQASAKLTGRRIGECTPAAAG